MPLPTRAALPSVSEASVLHPTLASLSVDLMTNQAMIGDTALHQRIMIAISLNLRIVVQVISAALGIEVPAT